MSEPVKVIIGIAVFGVFWIAWLALGAMLGISDPPDEEPS